MKYRVTALTPLLVGDGRKLSPIDYMVWRDQVNVLDQHRIFRLLAKGPRLEGYLNQLRKAEKLDFASWGGLAQSYAERRIPFEHPSAAAYWSRAPRESLFIPTFHAGPSGPYLPGTALKGALRTALLFGSIDEKDLTTLGQRLRERVPLRPALASEDRLLGGGGHCRLRSLSLSDSAPVPAAGMKVYLLRVAALQGGAHSQRYQLGWKALRGSVPPAQVEESTPLFAEMAAPGTSFEGMWNSRAFYAVPEVRRALRWPESLTDTRLLQLVNRWSQSLLALHREFAERSGLQALAHHVTGLAEKVAQAGESGACVLPLGWGGGLLTKTAVADTSLEPYRQVLRLSPFYARAIQTGLPFPKTRRVVFLNNQPAALPGWVLLERIGSAD